MIRSTGQTCSAREACIPIAADPLQLLLLGVGARLLSLPWQTRPRARTMHGATAAAGRSSFVWPPGGF